VNIAKLPELLRLKIGMRGWIVTVASSWPSQQPQRQIDCDAQAKAEQECEKPRW
jgi:hypothetical protein